MKKYTIQFLSVALIFGTASAVFALPFCDLITGDWWFTAVLSQSLTFDLDNDNLAHGNIGPEDLILPPVGLSIKFYDDGDYFALEKAVLLIDGYFQDKFEVDSGVETWYGSIWFKVFSDHKLTVSLHDAWGDFGVKGLKLFGNYCDVTSGTPVPEPETMLMLGFVLLGLVAISRKRFNHRN